MARIQVNYGSVEISIEGEERVETNVAGDTLSRTVHYSPVDLQTAINMVVQAMSAQSGAPAEPEGDDG